MTPRRLSQRNRHGSAARAIRDDPPTARARPVWLFDLDNTLHDASHAMFRAIDQRMTSYVERTLGVDRTEANRLRTLYWQRYGATLIGMVRHHGADPHDFLRECHDFDVAALLRAERGLARLFARLPGRKVLLSNAPLAYAGTVLRELALHRHIPTRYTIERMRVHGTFRPKPSRLMLRAMIARERIRSAQRCWSRTRSSTQVRAFARPAHGADHAARSGRPALLRTGMVGLRIASLHQLVRRRPR
jgi:putative hydrolase of the HAD superfamily